MRLEEGPPPRVVLLDQRRLPDEDVELDVRTVPELADAIRTLAVRGAPAIGVAAAYGLALAALRGDDLAEAEARSRRRGRPRSTSPGRSRSFAPSRRLHAHGRSTRKRSSAASAMAAHAAELFESGTRALTHCNAGGLATGGYGSAVGALRAAWERGLLEHVLVDETRPLLQGAASPRGSSRPPASRTR